MKRSKMSYIYWERMLIVAAITMLFLSLMFKLLFDSRQRDAYFNHTKTNAIGAFMRSLSFIAKEATKYKDYIEIPNINAMNYYNKTYYTTIIINRFHERMILNLLPITDFFQGQRMNLTIENPGRSK